MTKQEFLAMSLSYGLKTILSTQNRNYKINTIYPYSYQLAHDSYKNNTEKKDLCKPILHPLTDLTKPIEHKGEKFVPIVELAKMALNQNVNPLRFHKDDDGYYVELNNNVVFAYFYEQYCFGMYKYNELFTVTKQLQLFQKLIEWHFDIAGLIEKCEAIDVNTLQNNPYK